MSKTAALLPARLESSRLPRKPLVDIVGLPLIIHVMKRCGFSASLDTVFVVTDSHEIREIVQQHGGQAIMTGTHHQTGTDRIAEAAKKLPPEYDVVVNVQGDEALVNPNHIDAAVNGLRSNSKAQVALLVNPFSKRNSVSDIKTVLNERDEVMYLSRADIPSDARYPGAPMLKAYHVVPFRRDFLMMYASWPKGRLEQIEFNEYLRILEKGYTIQAIRVESEAISVDTPEDLDIVRHSMKNDPLFQTYAHPQP